MMGKLEPEIPNNLMVKTIKTHGFPVKIFPYVNQSIENSVEVGMTENGVYPQW